MELLAVLLGGSLALAGSFLAERHGAKARSEAAHRSRLEAFRRDLSEAVIAADNAQAVVDNRCLSYSSRRPGQLERELDETDAAVANARTKLLGALVTLPTGAPEQIKRGIETLRDSLESARHQGVNYAVAYSASEVDPTEAGRQEAHAAHEEAEAHLHKLVELSLDNL